MKYLQPIFGAVFAAIVFGLGLAISGLSSPAKVIGFLDVFGAWDPTLLFVMASALIVHMVLYRVVRRRESPLFAAKFDFPTRKDLDRRLITGAAIFGVGWGLSGVCPGPALVGLPSLEVPIVIFTVSMVAGVAMFRIWDARMLRRTATRVANQKQEVAHGH